MERRNFLRKSGVTFGCGVLGGVSGCLFENEGLKRDQIKFIEAGIERGETSNSLSIDAYVVVKNTGSEEGLAGVEMRVVREDGVRLSNWYESSLRINPGRKALLEVTFESGDSGWADSNDLIQVSQSGYVIFRYYNTWNNSVGDTIYRFKNGSLTEI